LKEFARAEATRRYPIGLLATIAADIVEIGMSPHVVALAGPLKGQIRDFSAGDLTFGREPTNTACVNDPKASRRHAVIRAATEGFTIVDLESRNGTFVNGVPIEQHLLEDGDQIEIGDSWFLFVVEERAAQSEPNAAEIEQETLLHRSLVQLRHEDSLYLKALQRKLLGTVFEAVPADSGVILLFEDNAADQPLSTFTLSRQPGSSHAVQVPRDLIRKVLAERNGLLSGPSVVIVPLFVFDRIIGVIYLEAANPDVRFDEGHLRFMMGVGVTAGLSMENVRQLEWLQGENRRLKADFNVAHTMVGEGPRMMEILRFIAKVAATKSTVLLRGESGTGKELVARAIHSNSSRSEKPFLAINCAALSETLLESELFGHEKGAFTGALAQKKGKLEIADGGTVFLDEVGELTPAIQAKLLHVLQERQFERVGGTVAIKVDIRIVAATNRHLEQAVSEGTFRQDLYYRLNVVSLTMPPLRERREDIPLLARYFAAQCSKKSGRPIKGISAEARQCLTHYDWPGNVRELENAMERAVVLGTTDIIVPEDLPEAMLDKHSLRDVQTTEYHRGIKDAKKRLILDAMNQAQGNYTRAAKLLGLHPNNLHRLIRDLDLKPLLKREHEEAEG
jgi:transcriptional regulator with GAF, ATPase, and Fis domain